MSSKTNKRNTHMDDNAAGTMRDVADAKGRNFGRCAILPDVREQDLETAGSPVQSTGKPLRIDGEVSLDRRGFIHVQIDLDRRLVHWQDSNQWNNNFVRALTNRQLEQINAWLLNWPEDVRFDAVTGDPMQWQISIEGNDGKMHYGGHNSRDSVWIHWKNMLRQTKIR